MKRFWIFVGGAYVSIKRNVKLATSLLIIVFLVIQFSFLIYLSVKVHAIDKEMRKQDEVQLQIMNRIYSQVWLLNSRMESVLDQKKK